MRPGLLIAFAFLPIAAASADSLFLTSKEGGARLAPAGDLAWTEGRPVTEKRQAVFVDPEHAFQSIVGIGGAITDAAAETLAKLPADKQEEVVRAYYDPARGIGYSLARTSIHSCDFSSESYTYVREGDTSLHSFSVAHDERFRLPLLRRALAMAGGKLKIFASPWSPPGWMKDDGEMLHGGHLKPEYRDAWAQYYVKFVRAYRAAGVPIWGLTVQNEPMATQKWESCVYSAEEERDFVRDHLGPALRRAGLDVKLMAWDHNRTLLYQRANVVLSDPAAAQYLWGIGYHWYVEDCFDNVRLVKESFPSVHVMLTEACNYPYDTAKRGDWGWGEKYGRAMIEDFNSGAEGWTDWNILLDQQGGPNHVGNYCYAPIQGDTTTGELFYQNSYYYIGHFSKFIRPGAKRIAASSTTDNLLTIAFRNPDGRIAVVVMNPTDAPVPFDFREANRSAQAESPAHSILTAVIGN